ncbi:MAG: pilus (MSHA type) biogenesis protein MshL [Burkholderiaceae bacterium]
MKIRPLAAALAACLVATSAPAATTFDLSVNAAPAPQVFMQLGAGGGYHVLVSPEVSGSVSVTLKNVTVPEALEALRDLYGYDYRIQGDRVFVYPNTVQSRLYRINYLPGRRQGASDIRVTSSSITQAPAPGTANAGGTTTSPQPAGNGASGARADDSSHVRTSSDADFWREVQASLNALVGSAGGRSVVLNPAAGVVVVKATPNELRQVEAYLKAVQVSIERQVMLEAKIVEIVLGKESQSGVNWSAFGKAFGSGQATVGVATPGTTLQASGALTAGDGTTSTPGINLATSALGKGFYGLAFQSANFAALLNFLQTQGDTQVLSSPRIATLNNQKAVLKVGSDELYVTGITTSTTTTGTGSVSTPSVTLQPFFSGIALDVTPQIDDAGNVILHVHPSISTVSEKQKNVDLGSLGAYRLPLAASTVNETDSIVRLRDGQIVAIGGLMLQETRDERNGVPVLSDVPLLGGLFRQTNTTTRKRELVVLIKPSVIHDDGVWPDAPQAARAEPAKP